MPYHIGCISLTFLHCVFLCVPLQASSSPKREQLCSLRNNRPPWESRILKSLEYHRRGKRFKHLKARSQTLSPSVGQSDLYEFEGKTTLVSHTVRKMRPQAGAFPSLRDCSIPFYQMFPAFSGKVIRLSFKIDQKVKYKLLKNIDDRRLLLYTSLYDSVNF